MQLGVDEALLPPTLRVVLTVGLLGGFTTFSAFSYETVRLAQVEAWGTALANVLASVIVGVVACWLGMAVART
jgi:CrcB protein